MKDGTLKLEDAKRTEIQKTKSSGNCLFYIFECKNSTCSNEFKLSKGHIKRYSGFCKKCSDLEKLKSAHAKVKFTECKRKGKTVGIRFIECKTCNKTVTTSLRAKKQYCSPKCRQYNENSFNRGSTPKKRYAIAKAAARRAKSKRSFSLTFEEYVEVNEGKDCYYCNGKVSRGGTGMDRIDNEGNYTFGNVVSCCGNCNRVRSNLLTQEETLQIIQLLKKIRGGTVWS